MIRAVVFDIGNVLINWNPDQLYCKLIPDEDERADFFKVADPHAMNDQVDRGAHFRDTIYAHAENFPKYRTLIRAWYDRWIEMASPAIEGSVATLLALRDRNVPVLALSNFGVESFAYAKTVYPFLTEFDQHYISGHMGVIKPDARIYQMLEQQCGFEPAELLFTDDREENIEAAAARGWNVHLFDGCEAWCARLQAEGLGEISARSNHPTSHKH